MQIGSSNKTQIQSTCAVPLVAAQFQFFNIFLDDKLGMMMMVMVTGMDENENDNDNDV